MARSDLSNGSLSAAGVSTTESSTTATSAQFSGPEFLGHPLGLTVLFLTEMWERFSYYGMRALLVLYMTKYLLIKANAGELHVFGYDILKGLAEKSSGPLGVQPLASIFYGWYTSLVYLWTIVGGFCADYIFGQRRSVVLGGILMAIGHFLMASESHFFLALAFIIIGCGHFKPNISTQVKGLYRHGDSRIDKAYSIFYMGINLGSIFSGIVCGGLGEVWGWHWGFGAAGVGMVVGLLIYLFGQKYLPREVMLNKRDESGHIAPLTSEQKRGILGFFIVCLLVTFYYSVYEQAGNTLQIFADQVVNWDFNLFGINWTMPSSWYQSFNPICILILTPIIGWIFTKMAKRRMEPASVTKMGVGCILIFVSYLILYVLTPEGLNTSEGSGVVLNAAQKIAPWGVIFSVFIYSAGELLVSALGLSVTAKIAPPRLASTLMGVFFSATAIGNLFSGYLGQYYSKLGPNGFFALCSAIAIATGFAYLLLSRPLNRAMGER